MPYFPGGGGVAYHAPPVFHARTGSQGYRQPARGTRGRFGLSLSDILGTVSDVAGTISDDTGSSPSSSYYTMSPQPAVPATSGLSTTTLLLGVVLIGGGIYFATKKH